MTVSREVFKLARALMDGQPIFITFAWAIQKDRLFFYHQVSLSTCRKAQALRPSLVLTPDLHHQRDFLLYVFLYLKRENHKENGNEIETNDLSDVSHTAHNS